MEAPQNSGTWHGKWATTQDSTLFGPEVRSYFPAGSTLVLDTDCFRKCRRALLAVKATRSTSHFLEKYWGLTSIRTSWLPSTTGRVRLWLKSLLCRAEVAYSLVKSRKINECCNDHGSTRYSIFPLSFTCILQKRECKVINLAEWRMLI